MPILDHLIRSALDRTTVGLALIDGGEVLWSNAAFDALAGQSGLEKVLLAQKALESEGLLELPGCVCRSSVHAGTTPALVELFPIPEGAFPSESDERDDLTGVLSRRSLEERTVAWFDARTEHPFALVFLDLDGFKAVNDRQGHLTGDACLREVGQRLGHAVRGADVVGRFGGDEFVLLLAGITSEKDFDPILRRLTGAIERPIATPAGPVQLGASLGAAFSGEAYASPEAMLSAADRAMYAQKQRTQMPADVAESARLG